MAKFGLQTRVELMRSAVGENGQMVIKDFSTAQIQLILVSNVESQLRQVTRDLQRSTYRYLFTHHSEKQDLPAGVARHLADNGGRLPTVLVINYRFAAKQCAPLLRLALEAARQSAIECVVTNPPVDLGIRESLVKMGAVLFNANAAPLRAETTQH